MNDSDRLSLMAIFAHPDDESFSSGGTLARYAQEQVFTSLLCATRGEAGEISNPALAKPDTLGRVREQELRQACFLLGVGHLRFLDYVDGTLTEVDPREFEGKIVRALRELRPQVVITFGPEGLYGHPDHVAVHQVATAAFHSAGLSDAFPEHFQYGISPWAPSKLYYSAPPREQFRRLGEIAAGLIPDLAWSGPDWEGFGVPEAKITTRVEIEKYVDTKLAALLAHQTQIQPNHPFTLLPTDLLREFLREECYMLAETRGAKPLGRESDLFEGVRVTAAT